MAYATLADLQARFDEATLIQLTDDAGLGTIDAARISVAIAGTDSLIDGHLASRVALPLAIVPAWLIDVACDLAYFRLWRTTPPESVVKARDAALGLLRKVSDGIIRLDDGIEAQPTRPGAVLVEGPDRVFSRQSLKGF